MVNQEQKTIKDAANRLKINYSTAKHIIKSQKEAENAQLTRQRAISQSSVPVMASEASGREGPTSIQLGKRTAPVCVQAMARTVMEECAEQCDSASERKSANALLAAHPKERRVPP